MKVLFICTGNTCRSPMAEVLLRQLVEERGIGGIESSSAGTGAWEGAPASEGALLVALEHGLDLASHRARRLNPELVQQADLVLTMSQSHLPAVNALGGGSKAHRLGSYAGRQGIDAEVADPIGGSLDEYRETYDQIRALIDAAIQRLVTEPTGDQR